MDFIISKGSKYIINTKGEIVSDKIIYTGSHNFTYSAMKRNSENSVRIISNSEAKKIKEYFTKIIE